jgi:hypothetical protein
VKRSSLVLIGLLAFIGLGFALPIILDQIGEGENLTGELPTDVAVYITSDYGKNLLANSSFDPDLGLTAMEMLHNMTEIETRYGGLFVNGAYGLRSNVAKRLDWFYYVNGAYMDRGLASYRPRRGEVVQVDYHFWGSYAASPGFLSGYPWRFLAGLGGKRWNVTIASGDEHIEAASGYAEDLSIFCDCSVAIVDPQDALLKDVEKNLILLVGPEGNALYSEIMGIRRNAFWPVEADGTRITINHLPSGAEEFEEGYALVATDLPGGRWALLVFATDGERMNEAMWRLGDFEPPGLWAAVMVNSEKMTPLPVQ